MDVGDKFICADQEMIITRVFKNGEIMVNYGGESIIGTKQQFIDQGWEFQLAFYD